MARFIVISASLHFVLVVVSGAFIGQEHIPYRPMEPVKVSLVEPAGAKNADMPVGIIADTRQDGNGEKPAEAEFLSSEDSTARGNAGAATEADGKTRVPPRKKSEDRREAARSPKKVPAASPSPEKEERQQSRKPDDERDQDDAGVSAQKSKAQSIASARVYFREKLERKSPVPSPENSPSREMRPDKEIPGEKESPFDGDGPDLYIKNNPGAETESKDEAVLSLNTKKIEYLDYFKGIRGAVEAEWAYPDEAIINGLSGRCLVRFTVSSDGRLEEAKVVASAGERSLDGSAVEAVKNAAPFAAFPANIPKKRIHIVATFTYRQVFSSSR